MRGHRWVRESQIGFELGDTPVDLEIRFPVDPEHYADVSPGFTAHPAVNAVVETYADRIEGLDESTLGSGPFRGVPFLMKDVPDEQYQADRIHPMEVGHPTMLANVWPVLKPLLR